MVPGTSRRVWETAKDLTTHRLAEFVPGLLTDLFAWAVVGLFVVGAVVTRRWNVSTARGVTTTAWGAFGLFWLVLFPHFAFTQKSYVEGILSLAAVPACLYAGWLLWNGRDSLFVMSRAIAGMGLTYLPFETIPSVSVFGVRIPAPRKVLIEIVTDQTGAVMGFFGYYPELLRGSQGFFNTYQFTTPEGHALQFSIILACTGLGSIAIFVGLVAAVEAPISRKLRALVVSVPVIWALNIARTSFIGITFGRQYLQVAVDEILFLFGSSDPYKVSFFISDRIISQVSAVIALIGVTYLVVRELPELTTIIEDVLFMITREEYDLAGELGLSEESDQRGRAGD